MVADSLGEDEHRIRAIGRSDTGFVIHCRCGWRSRAIDIDHVGHTWAEHHGA